MTATMIDDPPGPTTGSPAHVPVLPDAVAEVMAGAPAGLFVDLTVGHGGHARLVAELDPTRPILGIDRDPEAVALAGETLDAYRDRVELVHARSDDLEQILATRDIAGAAAILADLGVSSPQVDRPERGFSYRPDRSGPLDMRMDPTTGPTAAELLTELDEDAFVSALRDLGDEPHARRIARAVLDAAPRTTGELAEVVRDAVPAARRRSGDPAKRVFQTLRILVNDEISVLDRTLDAALAALVPGGRLAVISFHSVEDRMVKTRFRAAATGGCSCPSGLPCVCGAVPTGRLLRSKPWKADAAEVAANPRAASARLRAVEAL